MRIEVAGIPAPQGNHRVSRAGAIYETSRAVGPWREAVRAETQRALEQLPERDGFLEGPVAVKIVFRLPRPKSAPKSTRQPAKRPDLDKLCRAVLDGLTDGHAFADDGQVVKLYAVKQFAGDGDHFGPGARIWIEEA